MPRIRFYHLRTLLWTYVAWAALNALLASVLWNAVCYHSSNPSLYPITLVPYDWVLLHIAPAMLLSPQEIRAFGVVFPSCAVLSALTLVAGVLIKGRWACSLIIIGMSLWFLVAFVVLGVGV